MKRDMEKVDEIMEQVFKFPKKKKFNQWDKSKGDFDEQ